MKHKLDTVWRDGYFAGYRTLSGETIISTKEGIYRTRTVRRVPENVRWDAKIYEEFVFTPWKVNSTADEATQVMKDENPPMPSSSPQVSMEPPAVAAGPEVPRKMYIKTEDVNKHGYTPGCPGAVPYVRAKREAATMTNAGKELLKLLLRRQLGGKEPRTPRGRRMSIFLELFAERTRKERQRERE